MYDQRYANSDPTFVHYNDKTKQEAYGAKITGEIKRSLGIIFKNW